MRFYHSDVRRRCIPVLPYFDRGYVTFDLTSKREFVQPDSFSDGRARLRAVHTYEGCILFPRDDLRAYKCMPGKLCYCVTYTWYTRKSSDTIFIPSFLTVNRPD